MFKIKKTKITNLVLGILIFLIGIISLINLIKQGIIFGFEYAYLSSGGGRPQWLYSIGFILGGIAFIFDSFNRK